MRRRTSALAAAALVVVIVTSGVVVMSDAKQQAQAAAQPPATTVKVRRRELSAMVSQPGILTYAAEPDGSPYAVINEAHGIYTKLPAVGEVISQGQVLYRVDDRPVLLFKGWTPAYRTLAVGASGPDVAELNADLVALGYARSSSPRANSSWFGSATAAALERFQAAWGVPQTGSLPLGAAVFEPTTVRVTAVLAQLGGSTQIGQTALQATSTTREVQVALAASQQTTMAVGDAVSITLPNDRVTPGLVSSVGAVATCPSALDPGGSGSASAGPGMDTCSAGSTTTPTINVDVAPSDPAATGTWDQAPVQVSIVTARVPNALVVPVDALLAQSSGDYAVEVVGAREIKHLVPVLLGLFDDADGLVAVTGSGLAAGQEVVVPAT
jgi:peptidoglycan hydrolase-like protein with peptidoglycan-binding domain